MLDRYDYYIPQVGEIVRVKHFDHEEAMPDGLTFTEKPRESPLCKLWDESGVSS